MRSLLSGSGPRCNYKQGQDGHLQKAPKHFKQQLCNKRSKIHSLSPSDQSAVMLACLLFILPNRL